MKKYTLVLILVLSILLVTLNAFAGNLDPNKPPAPTMHTLNEIYELIESGSSLPRYNYRFFRDYFYGEETIHEGSGVIHSIIIGDIGFFGSSSTTITLIDGNDIICDFSIFGNDCPRARVISLDISYRSSLKIFVGGLRDVTVVYKPDN